MSDYLKHLNPEQKHAVETTEGPVLVLSGAGTGKTSVLVARIAYILENNLAEPWQILALTFTNKAANEMKSRVGMAVYPNIARKNPFGPFDPPLKNINDIQMGTFHSFGLRILRRHALEAGLPKDFLIYGEDEQKTVMKSVIAALNLEQKNYPPSDWIEKVQALKDRGLGHQAEGKIFEQIYHAYNAELARLGAVDFGDLILKTLELFATAEGILQKYQKRFKYIMVDEYQDTNVAQYQLVRMLAADHKNICCVGDDDQSIYSWRGADVKNILDFEHEYPGAKIKRLETNYRSTPMILGAANSLIKNNRDRLGKDLRPAPGAANGEKVQVLHMGSDFEEARMIADAVESAPDAKVAVLIRAGSLSRIFEEEFAMRGIPYRLVGATKFYDRAEIKDVIAYARLLCYPFDDLSFMRVISKPRRGFGGVALQKIRDHAAANRYGMLRALREFPLPGKQRGAADEFLAAFDFGWTETEPEQAVSELLERAGYMKMWRESKEIDAPDRLQNINELLTNVISKYDTLAEFLEHAALMMTEDNDSEITRHDSKAVSIMTIHAAKGLEFDTVFMPAWEEGIFPNEMAINAGGLEEERRLAYVAITRARNCAVISHTISRMVFGKRQYNESSRFIREIDKEFTEEKGIRSEKYETRAYEKNSKLSFNPYASKSSMVGQLVRHETLGAGVVIEQEDDTLTVAFKDKGIKKVAKQFVTF